MPACYAHYQFGQDILSRLGGAARSAVLAYRREFDCGLQGPDVFFFYKPWRSTRLRDYGAARHKAPAERMFAPILETVREGASLACLIGLICHYALDKRCHPYVNAHGAEPYDHQRMEAAFDRALMTRAGFPDARCRCLPVSGLDYGAMSALWPGVGAKALEACVRWERRAVRLLDRRHLLESFDAALKQNGALTVMTLPDTVSSRWAEDVRQLFALYDTALNECPALIASALGVMGRTPAALAGFELNYKGEAAQNM